jgi:hypothetical protein
MGITGDTHRFHSHGQYDHCAGCQAERAQLAAGVAREHDARIDENVAALVTTTGDAYTALGKIRRVIDALTADYDIELVEGSDGDDVKHELGVAERALRNIERIARHRASQ